MYGVFIIFMYFTCRGQVIQRRWYFSYRDPLEGYSIIFPYIPNRPCFFQEAYHGTNESVHVYLLMCKHLST